MNLAKVATHFFGIPWVVFFVFLSLQSRAQDQCEVTGSQFTGSLQIDVGIGCVPLKIKASTGFANATNVRYVYTYQGGTVKDSDLTRDSVFTYSKSGLFRVLQYSERNGQQLRACVIIQVYDTLQPEIVLEPCLTRVLLRIPKSADYQYNHYVVNWGDGSREQLDGKNPVGLHTYSDDKQRLIEVKGVHLYGNCGGTARVTFRPDTKAVSPTIDNVKPAGANSFDLTISNPGGNRFWIEKRSPDGTYARTILRSDAVNSTIGVEADTTQSVCFRLVLADTCLQATPLAEVCSSPPKPPVPVLDSTVFMPDAFSPNADGINDRFQLQGLLSGTARLTVFNRWGEVIFRTDDAITGWDGQQRDRALPAGTYVYVLELEKQTGQRMQKRGAVFLMR